jgi:hypothetical protein
LILLLCVWDILLGPGDVFGEPLEFGAFEHLGINHAHEQSLDRPITKPVHNALRGAAGYTLS